MIHSIRFADIQLAAEGCAKHILGLLEEAMKGGSDATLAVSGGSSPKLMFEVFAKTQFAWDRVQLFWVDERGVPPTDSQSNFKMTNEAWLMHGNIPQKNIHRILAEKEAHEAAQLCAADITSYFKLSPGQIPKFDVIHRGMGPDCHTASLFPGEPMIDNRTDLIGAVWVEKFKQWRITMLPGVLRAAKHSVMLVTGKDKAQPLYDVLNNPIDLKKYPVQVTHDVPNVTWILDEPAAALLTKSASGT
jgi:6-phosphogluconolactonase